MTRLRMTNDENEMNEHDKAYAEARARYKGRFDTYTDDQLSNELRLARENYRSCGPTHHAVARLDEVCDLLRARGLWPQ